MKNRKKRTVKAKKPLEPRRPATSSITNNTVALSISAVMLGGTALAQEAQDEEEAVLLDKVQVQDRTIDTNPYAEPGVPYKARISGDPRRLREIADTPVTMSVLTQTQIEDSGKSDLREILAAQPGITLGTGEGGNAFGDRYIIRGHEARSDVFVDGLRDPGMTVRESFALEQVEVTKGPSSTFAGRGSAGGAINGVTKQASSEYDFINFQGGVGTDEYYRVHLDANKRITDELAVRANLLYADEEVPDRAPAERLRRGAALSGRYDPRDNTFYVSFDYYFLDAKDDPDLGTQIERFGDPIEDIPTYLQKGRDFLESEVHTFTFRGGYEFSDQFRLESNTRYGFMDNGYVLTGARGHNPYRLRQPNAGVEYARRLAGSGLRRNATPRLSGRRAGVHAARPAVGHRVFGTQRAERPIQYRQQRADELHARISRAAAEFPLHTRRERRRCRRLELDHGPSYHQRRFRLRLFY